MNTQNKVNGKSILRVKNEMAQNKKAIVFNYILDAIDGEGYGVELLTSQDKINFVYSCFQSEYCFKENLLYYGGERNAFANWLMGLPSSINIDFENYKILEIAKLWGSIPENATEKQEDEILGNWFSYITSHFFQLHAKLQKRKELSKAYSIN